MKFRSTDGIFIDGIPLSDVSNKSYYTLASYFSQNTPVITDTISNNLTIGTDCKNANRLVDLPFLQKFDKMDEFIFEDGANLSGGDKQRIALARYFLEDTALVVLDEPTSSIDSETESELLDAVFGNSKNKIIFYVTHKAENLRYCTHRVEIKNGTVLVNYLANNR